MHIRTSRENIYMIPLFQAKNLVPAQGLRKRKRGRPRKGEVVIPLKKRKRLFGPKKPKIKRERPPLKDGEVRKNTALLTFNRLINY